MNESAVRSSLLVGSDSRLMGIATGSVPGYTPAAQRIAEDILLERGVALPPDLLEQRRRAEVREAEEERERAAIEAVEWQSSRRTWGIRLLVIGLGSFALPLFGYQFRILSPFGYAVPILGAALAIAGYVMLVRAAKARTEGDTPA